jgi:hypothetical protein
MDDGGPGGTGGDAGSGGSSDDDASADSPTIDEGGTGGTSGTGTGGSGGSSSDDASDDTASVDAGSDAGSSDVGSDAPAACGTPWQSGHAYALNDTASGICSDTAGGANNCTIGTTYIWQCVYQSFCSSIAPGTSDSYAIWHVVSPCN